MNDKIDIVIPWVDGLDPIWQKEKVEWEKKTKPDTKFNSNNRYQSWDNIKYWFRAIEKFMPWINRVFFITYGHVPSFLRDDNSKLKIINHKDYIPKEYLPTFNANTIELNIYRIKQLGENFIYFNDDLFPLEPIDEEYFFRNNKVCDEAIETPIIPILNGDIAQFTWNMRALDVAIINKHFCKRNVQERFRDKWFCSDYGDMLERNKSLSYWENFVGFRDPHMPVAFKKHSFKKVWEEEHEILDKACSSKFRNYECVNQWLIRYWQLCEGDFYPRRTLGKSYVVTNENSRSIANDIVNHKYPIVCLNEDCNEEEFEGIKNTINNALKTLLPKKSSFEK